MDLVALIAACAVGQDPAMMQAIVLQASAGQPYSYYVAGESAPRAFATIEEVVAAARAAQGAGQAIRLGLAGIAADLAAGTSQPNEVLFEPCVNLDIAARQLDRATRQCRELAPSDDPFSCALATYLGSAQQPDVRTANAVLLAMAQPLENPEVRGVFEPIPPAAPGQPPAADTAAPDPQQEFLAAGGALFIENRSRAQQPAQAAVAAPAAETAPASDEEGGDTVAESLFVSARPASSGQTRFIDLPAGAAYDQ